MRISFLEKTATPVEFITQADSVPRPAVGESGIRASRALGILPRRGKKGAHRKESKNKTSNIEADINFCRWKI